MKTTHILYFDINLFLDSQSSNGNAPNANSPSTNLSSSYKILVYFMFELLSLAYVFAYYESVVWRVANIQKSLVDRGPLSEGDGCRLWTRSMGKKGFGDS